MARTDRLELVANDDAPEGIEAEAEQRLLAAFASARESEKSTTACVEIPRYPNTPKRDPNGNLVLDEEGKLILGPLELYFHRLEAGTFSDVRVAHTHQVAVRRRGRTEYEDKIDDEALSLDVAYRAMLPWCRARYFDNQALWGNEAVGTGQEFLRVRLNLGELSYCLDAVMQLEGLGDERADALGKH